jgi:hypothetical protein
MMPVGGNQYGDRITRRRKSLMNDWLADRARRVPRRSMMIGLASGGAAVGIGGLLAASRLFSSVAVNDKTGPTRDRVKPHIDKADADSQAGVDSSLQPLQAFFDQAKGSAAAFADDVLGWTSKYRLIRGQHEEFLADAFCEHFFGPDELKQAMTNAVARYVATLEAIDNRMLVDISVDVADLPAGMSLAAMPVPDLQERYRSVCSRVGGVTGADAAVDVGRAAADMIVGSVVTMMAARFGTSAVALGAGAASGWWTFGIGLVVGVVVDQIIAAVWNWTYDPHGKLVDLMETKIDEVRNLVLDGCDGKPGLREELRRYADKRAIVRREAVLELLADATGGNRS